MSTIDDLKTLETDDYGFKALGSAIQLLEVYDELPHKSLRLFAISNFNGVFFAVGKEGMLII